MDYITLQTIVEKENSKGWIPLRMQVCRENDHIIFTMFRTDSGGDCTVFMAPDSIELWSELDKYFTSKSFECESWALENAFWKWKL